jgi:hypothetical protein
MLERGLKMYERKLEICIVLIILFTLLTLNLTNFPFISEAETITSVYIHPALTCVQFGDIFSLNISIAVVTDLCGWEFKLYYQNSVLNATDYEEGPFLKSGGSTSFYVPRFTDNYNETHGLIGMICTLNDFANGGVNGDGVLASVTFKARNAGNSSLILQDTKLRNRNIQPINHTTTNGNVQVLGFIDIAVTSVNPLKTIVGQGYTMKINSTFENQGDQTETFNVTTYANTTVIQTKTIILETGALTTVTFTWNTTGFAKGSYIISAYAWSIQGETDTSDNTCSGGIVKVAIPGDINADGVVDIFDAVILSGASGSTPSSSNWETDANADINDDFIVDLFDAVILAGHAGQTDP